VYEADRLVETVLSICSTPESPFIVCTGGEPLLQMDDQLIAVLHAKGCAVAVETNGTKPAIPGIDWITVSPKIGTALRQTSGNELKLVYPQDGLAPAQFESCAFDHFFLQPIDSPKRPDALARCIEYCLLNPKWRLSMQLNKAAGIK
jgi:organic radical activating enzyme